MVKWIKIIALAVLLGGVLAGLNMYARAAGIGGGSGTISSLEQWTSTSSPAAGITQRVFGKSVIITGVTTGTCLSLDANHTLTTMACGGAGSSFDYPFVPTANYGVTQSATNTPVWGRGGLYASTTGTTNALSVSSSGNGRAVEVVTTGNGPGFWFQCNGTGGYCMTGIMKGTSVNPIDIAHNPDSVTTVSSVSFANNVNALGPVLQLAGNSTGKGLLLSCWVTGDWCDRVQSQGFGVFISANGDGGASTPLKVASGLATTTILEINSSGNLAIGSFTTIAHKLEVGSTTGQNTARINGLSTANNAPIASFFRSGTVEWAIGAGGTSASDFSISANPNSTYTDASLASNAKLTIKSTGNVGIGTSSPYAALSVNGQTVALYFTATSTTQASTLPYASTTALSVSTLTSGNCVQAGTGGLLTDTGSACGSGGATFGYPFTTATNYGVTASATSTPLWARAGLFASSTSQFDQINVGSSTSGAMATSTFYGNVEIKGRLRDDSVTSALILDDSLGLAGAYGGTSCTNQAITALSAAGAASCGTFLQALGNYGTTTNANISFSTTTKLANGLTYGMQIIPSADGLLFTPTVSGTYSGQAGSVANALTVNNSDTGIGSGGTFNGSAAVTISRNTIGAIGTTSPWTVGQMPYVTSVGLLTSVATSTLAFSGPFSGTGFGALVGGANTTLTWTGLATSTALTANQVLYASSITGVAGNNNHVWLNGPGWLGVGTSTPQWLVTLATSTAPQLVLTDAIGSPWAIRDAGSNLYFATTTNTTFATSTKAALTIDANGFPTFNALGGVAGCAQFDNTGKISNTGTTCGTSSSAFEIATTSLTISQLTYVNQVSGRTTLASVATSTLAFSGPFSGTGFGALVGGANTTVTWTGLATSSPLTTNNLLYASNATTGVAPAGKLTWLNGPSWLGIGTTTPQWEVTIATTTAPQLVLQGGVSDAPWALRSIGGALYFATTTNTATFATSSAANTSLTIDTNGFPRFSALGGVAGCAQFDNTGKIANTGTVCGNSVSAFEMATTSLTISQLTYVNQVSGRTTLASVATTTKTYSGPFNITAGAGALVGGSNSTLTWTGLATTTLLATNQVLYAANSTTGVAGSNNHVWLNGPGWLGVGTSTPQWLTTLATTTAAQLVLEGGNSDAAYAFRSIGGSLYIATTSPTTFATTSLAVFSITPQGQIASAGAQGATSTAITLDWKGTPNLVQYAIGSAATTVYVINATTSDMLNSRKTIVVTNPATVAAGALTLLNIKFMGTTPTQTTTAGSGDIYSCIVVFATSTTGASLNRQVECTAGAGVN